ncbi:MAG: AAA family ATPase [Longibaculum sp.]
MILNELFVQKIKIDWEHISKESYLRDIDSLFQLDELKFEKNVTFFVGENGSGKSTLLEAIAVACGFNAEGGTRNYHFFTYETHSKLCQAMTIVKGWRKMSWGYFLRAESFYNVATKEMEYADSLHPSKKYHEKSHGESFLALVQNNFQPNGLYLLDEPEAALSPQRQLTLLVEMNKLSKLGAQFIVVTHSPILLGLPDAQIYSFDHIVHKIGYEETDSYQITEMFINNRNQLLEKLFDENEM